jgi:nitroreductase
MEVYEAIRARHSVRSYRDRPVEPAKLNRVLEAAHLAPSARNDQEWRFVVVSDQAKKEALATEASSQHFMLEAPLIIAACAQTDGRVMGCGQLAYPIDVAIALDHLTLAAVAEGLGTCWIGSFDPARVRRILGIPPEVQVVELMLLGYPRETGTPPKKSRLPLEQVVHREAW